MVDGEEYKYGSSRLASRLKRLLSTRWTHVCCFSIALSGMLLWSTPKPQSWLGLQTGSSSQPSVTVTSLKQPSSSSSISSSSSSSSPSLQAQRHTPLSTSFLLPSCPYFEDIPTPFPCSFWYVKNFKTASSTMAGVFRSIAAHHGIPLLSVRNDHSQMREALNISNEQNEHTGMTNHLSFSHKIAASFKQPFYRFSTVREPVSRFHSAFVESCIQDIKIAAKEKGKENATLIAELEQEWQGRCFEDMFEERKKAAKHAGNVQFQYLKGDRIAENEELTGESVAFSYAFLFVKERLYESLVVFAILFNLDFDDIVHLSSKVRTGKYPDASHVPTEINELVRIRTRRDLEMWEHANKLLDGHITTISQHCGGDGYFKEMLELFQKLQEAVATECGDKYEEWYNKHGFNTTLTYFKDNGQGPRCRDHVVKNVLRKRERR